MRVMDGEDEASGRDALRKSQHLVALQRIQGRVFNHTGTPLFYFYPLRGTILFCLSRT